MVYSLVLSQLNHKIKSLWVKHSWFYLNYENHENISPRKFPAIWYVYESLIVNVMRGMKELLNLFQLYIIS